MGVDADVVCLSEAVVKNALEHTMHTVHACHAVDDMVGQGAVRPFPLVDVMICRVRPLLAFCVVRLIF